MDDVDVVRDCEVEDLDDAPALRGRQRTGLHDEDPVADATVVGLVVGLQLHRAAQDLARRCELVGPPTVHEVVALDAAREPAHAHAINQINATDTF